MQEFLLLCIDNHKGQDYSIGMLASTQQSKGSSQREFSHSLRFLSCIHCAPEYWTNGGLYPAITGSIQKHPGSLNMGSANIGVSALKNGLTSKACLRYPVHYRGSILAGLQNSPE